MHYLKFSVLLPVDNYLYLYIIFLFFWIIFTLYYDKVDILIEKSTYLSIRIIFWSSLLSLLFVVIVLSFSDLWSVSRLYVISFVSLFWFFEVCLSILLKLYIGSKQIINDTSYSSKEDRKVNKFYIKWILPGIFFLIFTYMMLVYLKGGSFQYSILHEKNFLILISAWGLGTLLTNRYKEPITINHYYEIAPYIKATILTFLFLTFFYYSLRISPTQ